MSVTLNMRKTVSGTAQLAVALRGPLVRFDVLSVQSDSMPLPQIGATAVIDRRVNTLTVWNDRTKQYYVQRILPGGSATPRASASPRPTPSPRASASPRRSPGPGIFSGPSPLSKLDVLDVTLHLTGHTTTVGLPTTGLAFDFAVKRRGDTQTTHVTAATQLADDYGAFPITLDVSLEPGGMGPFAAKLAYAVDRFTAGAPADTQFAIPAGYTKAASLPAVLFAGARPRPVPSGITATPRPQQTPRP